LRTRGHRVSKRDRQNRYADDEAHRLLLLRTSLSAIGATMYSLGNSLSKRIEWPGCSLRSGRDQHDLFAGLRRPPARRC
jgi:hypothetical protein